MPTPPGFAAVSHQLTLTGFPRSAYITYGIDATGTNPTTIAGQCASAFAAAGGIFTILDSQVTMSGTRVSLGTDGGEDLIGFSVQNVAGTSAGQAHPPNCAMLVHKRTARGGRRGRGRFFLPWVRSESDTDEAGIWTGAAVTAAQNAMTAWWSAIQSGPGPMVLLHQDSAEGTENPTTPGAPDVVTALEVDSLISTQRRRLGRR